MITRRELLLVFGAGALAAPLASFAQQQGKVWRVGYLRRQTATDSINSDRYVAFVQGLRDLGYVEGKNLIIESASADGKVERLSELAAELIRQKVDVIVATSTPVTRAAQKATTTIPIVMITIADPVGSGFVKSLARPEGNITGLTNVALDTVPKHLEMLLALVPKLSRVAVLANPDNVSNIEMVKSVQAAARKTNVKILSMETRTAQNIEYAFSMMSRQQAGAVIITQDPLFIQQRSQIAGLAVKYQLPSIAAPRELAEAGILMSYGPSFADMYRRAATYIDKIFKGAKPANLPVEQPNKFEMLINRKTAAALGLTIPQELLLRADKVIE